MLLSSGVPVKDVQEIAGHSKPSVTLNTYWQSVPGAGGRVADTMGALLPTNDLELPTRVETPPAIAHELPT